MTQPDEQAQKIFALLRCWLAPQRVACHIVDKFAVLGLKTLDVLLAPHRDRMPLRAPVRVVKLRRFLLWPVARLFPTALLDAAREDDLGVGVAVLALLDLAVGILNHGGDVVEAQSF